MADDPYDVIVVGARCAGSPTAMLLAQRGYRVLMVDRDQFPSDVISTHYIHPRGVDHLLEWGLLDAVLATNCPPITKQRRASPEGVLEGDMDVGDSRSAMALCPRRTVLDTILIDAAVEAGVEFRAGLSVSDVLRDGDTVTGIVGRSDGDEVSIAARMVIGADGQYSRIARAVGAEQYEREETVLFGYYAYFSGVPSPGLEVTMGNGGRALVFQTNDDQVCVALAWAIDRLRDFRRDIETNFYETIDGTIGDLGARVRAGKRESDFFGMADLPYFKRQSHGPGWALAGDAGYHIDPISGHGMSNAWDHLPLLVDAVDETLSGRRPAEQAMADSQRRRDEVLQPFWDTNLATARMATGVAIA